MKKLTVLSIVAASLLLVGCGDSATGAEAKAASKPAVEAAAPAAAEATKEVAAPVATEATKTAATEAKEAAATAVEKTTEAVKETVTEAKDAVVETAAAATEAVAEKATEAKDAVAATATAAVESTKEAASAVAEKATQAVAAATGPDGKALFAKCAGCHGADGKTAALGKSAVIAGQAKADLVTKIHAYKAGTRNTKGMGALMKGQVASYSDADIEAVAGYISGL